MSGRGPAPYNLLAWSRNCQPRRQAPAKGWSVAFFFFFFFSSSGTDSISQELLKKMKLFAIRTPPPLIIRMQWMITYVIPLSPPLPFLHLCCARMVWRILDNLCECLKITRWYRSCCCCCEEERNLHIRASVLEAKKNS